jgi:carbamate kinase
MNSPHQRTIVVALGGNALVSGERTSILDQLRAVEALAPALIGVVAAGHRLVITHGNGPQVGYILRRSELAIAEVNPVPVDFAVADTQGAIGHMFLLALRNELLARGMSVPVTALVTDVVVDSDDPAFARPAKPIGSHFPEQRAHELAARFGWTVAEDAGRGWRRVVASPEPVEIIERDAIGSLLRAGHVVVAGGGGGVPVVRRGDGSLQRVEAVVDKDLTSALLGAHLHADMLVIVTAIDRVAIGFGTDAQRWLLSVSADEMLAFLAAGEFAAGSMAPKVDAAIRFVDGARTEDACAVITSVDQLSHAIADVPDSGTRITKRRA